MIFFHECTPHAHLPSCMLTYVFRAPFTRVNSCTWALPLACSYPPRTPSTHAHPSSCTHAHTLAHLLSSREVGRVCFLNEVEVQRPAINLQRLIPPSASFSPSLVGCQVPIPSRTLQPTSHWCGSGSCSVWPTLPRCSPPLGTGYEWCLAALELR